MLKAIAAQIIFIVSSFLGIPQNTFVNNISSTTTQIIVQKNATSSQQTKKIQPIKETSRVATPKKTS